MIGNRRVLGAAVAAVLVASLGALAGCASDEKPEVALTQKQVQAASVTLTVHDVNGAQVGQGSGILIAPRLVLTSAHLVAGKARWGVTSADGTTKVNGIRGMTYDWMDYDNGQNAHPRKHDVAVIYLDKPINLETYPKMSSEGLANNAQGTRLRSNGASVLQLPQTFKKVVGFPHSYLTDMPSTESVEPGNAVLNEHNEIVGVVTGRGLTTGSMYVARTNDLGAWLSPKAQCGGRSSASVRTYGTPPPKPGCDTPGSSGNTSGNTSGSTSGSTSGGTSGSTSGDNTSGNTSGGTSGSTSGDQSSGTSGTSGQSSGSTSGASGNSSGGSSGGTDNPSCHDGGGHCHGDCHGVPNDNSSSGSSGSSGQTSSGSTSGDNTSGGSSGSTSGDNTSGSSGASSSGTSGTSGQTSSSSGTSGDNTSGSTSGSTSGDNTSGSSGASSSGTSGTSGQSSGSTSGSSGQSSGGNSSGNTTSSGGAGSENGGDDEVCEGSHDNPETCPPEDDGCHGKSCGGAFAPDGLIDYGGCGSCGSSDSDDKIVVK